MPYMSENSSSTPPAHAEMYDPSAARHSRFSSCVQSGAAVSVRGA